MAGLMEKRIDTDTLIDCVGVFDKYADEGYAPQCWIYGKGLHGELNVVEALGHSCNLFFYTTGDLLQISLLAKPARLFGLGEETGI
jgi:penicillin-binding protein 2